MRLPARDVRALYHEAVEQVLDSIISPTAGDPRPDSFIPRGALNHEMFERNKPDGSLFVGYRVKINVTVEIGLHDANMNPKWRGRW